MVSGAKSRPGSALIAALRNLIRVTFVVQLVLGLLFWTDRATQLTPLHRVLGFVLVFGLWTLAILGARAGLSPLLVAAAVIWGLVAPVLGLTRRASCPGRSTGSYRYFISY